MLTIYALAHDSMSTEDVYISIHDKVKLYIKLTDDTGRTVVQRSVTSLRQALNALKNYTVTDVDVCYNVDVTDKIYKLANKINLHFFSVKFNLDNSIIIL